MPGPHVSAPTGPAHREQSPDDGRPSTSSGRGPALKRQLSSRAQVYDSHQSAENEMPLRKRRRMDKSEGKTNDHWRISLECQ